MRFVSINSVGQIGVVSICKEPVNLMDYEIWTELQSALDTVEADPLLRGIIFRSGLNKDIFTAGYDIKEIYTPLTTQQKHKRFWVTSNIFLANLYRSNLVTIAAVRGACPAAGCILSLCCDYRILSSNGYMGLNEPALGIPVPKIWVQLMGKVIGYALAEKLCQFGKLNSAEYALSIGLVDQVVSVEELEGTAEKAMKEFLKIPDEGRQITKAQSRNAFADHWESYCVEEVSDHWEMLSSPRIQSMLGKVIQRLSQRKSKM